LFFLYLLSVREVASFVSWRDCTNAVTSTGNRDGGIISDAALLVYNIIDENILAATVSRVGLSVTFASWNITFHARWTPLTPSDPGFFDKGQDCVVSGGDYRQDDCCGAYGTASTTVVLDGTYPFAISMRRPYATTNPRNGCCQDVFVYDVVNQECCIADDSTVSVTGTGDCVGTVAPADERSDFSYAK
jgi:hypothetical protein